MNLTPKQQAFVDAVRDQLGLSASDTIVLTRAQVLDIAAKAGLNPPQWLMNGEEYRYGRGQYRIGAAAPKTVSPAVPDRAVAAAPAVKAAAAAPVADLSLAFHTGSLVPDRLASYVPFGCHHDIKKIVSKRSSSPSM